MSENKTVQFRPLTPLPPASIDNYLISSLILIQQLLLHGKVVAAHDLCSVAMSTYGDALQQQAAQQKALADLAATKQAPPPESTPEPVPEARPPAPVEIPPSDEDAGEDAQAQ